MVVAGPAHRVPVAGVGVTTARAWRTPARRGAGRRRRLPGAGATGLAVPADDAHRPEHSLEVHLPFVLEVLGPVAMVPLVVGRCPPGGGRRRWPGCGATTRRWWWCRRTSATTWTTRAARARDQRTTAGHPGGPAGRHRAPYDACGCVPVAGLMLAARVAAGPATLAVATSADTSGDAGRVVGYGSFGFGPARPLGRRRARWLLARARAAVAHELRTGEVDPLDDDDVPERVLLPGATFVTLQVGGELVGCIGSLEARRPLWRDVARNARSAAFADPRFPAAGRRRPRPHGGQGVGAVRPRPAAGRPRRPGRRAPPGRRRRAPGGRRPPGHVPARGVGQAPGPEDFVDRLVGKAGLPADPWPADAQVWRYTTDEFADAG